VKKAFRPQKRNVRKEGGSGNEGKGQSYVEARESGKSFGRRIFKTPLFKGAVTGYAFQGRARGGPSHGSVEGEGDLFRGLVDGDKPGNHAKRKVRAKVGNVLMDENGFSTEGKGSRRRERQTTSGSSENQLQCLRTIPYRKNLQDKGGGVFSAGWGR